MFGIKRTKQFMAAQNALVAKYTFFQMSEKDQELIIDCTLYLLETGGFPKDDVQRRMEKLLNDPKEELERFLFFSQAMLRFGVEPALHGLLYEDTWNPLKQNPFIILFEAEKEIEKVKRMIKAKCNVDMDKIPFKVGFPGEKKLKEETHS